MMKKEEKVTIISYDSYKDYATSLSYGELKDKKYKYESIRNVLDDKIELMGYTRVSLLFGVIVGLALSFLFTGYNLAIFIMIILLSIISFFIVNSLHSKKEIDKSLINMKLEVINTCIQEKDRINRN